MSWTHDDPGQGSPAGIQGVAGLRTARAAKIRDAQRALHSAGSQSGVDWEASSQKSFAAELSKHAADIELVATGLEKQASALTTYAGQLSQIKDRQVVLEQQRRSAQDKVAMANLKMLASNDVPDVMRADGSSDVDARKKLAAAKNDQADASAALNAVETQWEQLVADRRSIDASCARDLRSSEVLGRLSGLNVGAVKGRGTDAILGMLGQLSEADLAILLRVSPELVHGLDGTDPEKVAGWWASLPQEQKDTLIAGAPAVVGALNGVPALARVAANKRNAADRLVPLQNKLDRLEKLARDAGRDPGDDATITALRSQVAYLKGATAEPPTVQLYLYQPELDRIVEMVGTPSASTNKVVTYSPGTFGNLQGFYDGGTQKIAFWLQQQDRDGLVAFVYKDGRYPQNPITEANDQDYARQTGAQLASFEDGLFQDPLLRGKDSIAIGHSWGGANIASSESVGAAYDTVVSLSGAGVPRDWRKNSSTSYADFSYRDILQDAQDIRVGDHGVVWGGRNPRDIGFDHGDYYKAPESWVNFPGNVLVSPLLLVPAGIDSHNLTATADSENQKLLGDMREYIYNESVK